MIEQVMDIQAAIKNLRIQMDSMQLHLDSSHEEICKLNRNNQRAEKENHALRKENKELKERLSKYEQPSKDSNNSSTPPSKESLKSEVIRRANSLREKSGRPVGGQQGHEGHMRKMVAAPDKIVEHTSCFCTDCGRDLSDIESTLEYTTQEIDILLTSPIVSEHRYRAKICNCGCHNRPYAPKKKGGNDVTFGKNIQSLVAYLNVVQCVPYERLQPVLNTIFSVDMGQGTIKNIIARAKEKAEPALELIKERIIKSQVVGFDESGCYCSGRLDWSWIAQTIYCTLVSRASNRAGKVLEDEFGDALKEIIAVTDRHSAYFSLNFKDHQICLAHILREL